MWVDFSRFGRVDIEVGPISTTVDADYKDIWVGSFGGQYRLSDRTTFVAGLTYVSSGVSDSNRTLGLPWDELWIFGIGVERRITPSLRLHTNLLYV